jgi:hypothetical protein
MPDHLTQTLAALHRELSEAQSLDEPSRQLLREIVADLERLGPSPVAAPAALHPHRLEKLAVGFEVEHPTLAAALRQLMDLLSKAGL